MNNRFHPVACAGIAIILASGGLPLARAADEPNAGQPSSPDEIAVDTAKEEDHQALRRLRTIYEQAVSEDDVDLLRPHLHSEFTGVMVTGELVEGFEGLVRYWADIKTLMARGGKYSTKVTPDGLSRIIGDLAIARGVTEDQVVTGAGQEYNFTSPWTAVCAKEDGHWKLLRVQGTMDPIGNPFVATMRRTHFWLGGAAGAVAGFLIGLAIMMILRKRSTTDRPTSPA